jgi:multiple sugar transport system substrate-binding protein
MEARVHQDRTAPAAGSRRLRLGALVGLAGLAAVAAAGCSSSGSGSGASSGPVSITYWTSSTQSEINYLDSHFNSTHKNIKVTGQYIASADNTTAKEVAALKSNTEPNIVIGQDPSALPLLAESGKIVPLNKPLAADTAALYPGIRSALFYKGQQLGLALGGVGNYLLFYNKSDFSKAGISGPPTTWTQLEADAIKLSDPAKHHYGVYIPLGSSEWISYEWEALLWANGGQFLNANDTKVAFDSPAGIQALTTWVSLVGKDHAAPTTSYAQAGSYDGAPAFASNAVAMIVDGQWAVSTFSTAHINYGVALVPAGTSGQSAANIGIGVATVFNKSTTTNNAALTFVQWLGQPQQGAYLTSVSGGLPSAPNQLTQPAVQAEQSKSPTYATFAEQLKYGHSRPTVPAYAAISLALSNEIYAALQGKISPAAALAAAAAQGNQAIANGAGS